MTYACSRQLLLSVSLILPLSFNAACNGDASAAEENAVKAPLGLDGVELAASDDELTAEKYELGKQLFFDTRLSGTGKTSCSSCHLPEHAFTDQRPVSPKDNGKLNSRNSPTMYNVGYLTELYWDGRAKGLDNNVMAAWTGQVGGKPDEVAKALGEIEGYKTAFQEAYGAAPSPSNINQAMASFLRGLRSGDSAYDRFEAGQTDALSEAAQKGLELFKVKAGCMTCHTMPLFTDRMYHNVGIGMTAENPDLGAGAKKSFDDAEKNGAFKTPTLREIAKTGPYLHDGSATSLRDVVKIMAGGGIANANKDPLMIDRKLTDEEIDQLVAFLESLSGNQQFTKPTLPQ